MFDATSLPYLKTTWDTRMFSPAYSRIFRRKRGDDFRLATSWLNLFDIFFCFFVCLFKIHNRIVPTGSTPKGGPTEITLYHPGNSSPPGLVSVSVPSPPLLMLCILSVPSPVLLSYTYTLSSLWSVSSLFFCPTHIFKLHRKEPLNKDQTPHTNCVNSLFQ